MASCSGASRPRCCRWRSATFCSDHAPARARRRASAPFLERGILIQIGLGQPFLVVVVEQLAGHLEKLVLLFLEMMLDGLAELLRQRQPGGAAEFKRLEL